MLDVLLVCTGNICRSPIAEGILSERSKRLLDGRVRVRSAGTWARDGREPMPEAVAAAHGHGVDIRTLESTRLTDGLVAESDLILTMTEEQREEVVDTLPPAAPKTYTLKELAELLARLEPLPERSDREGILGRIAAAHRLRTEDRVAVEEADIVDPLGLSLAAYRAIAAEIGDTIDTILHLLFGIPREHIQPAGARVGDK